MKRLFSSLVDCRGAMHRSSGAEDQGKEIILDRQGGLVLELNRRWEGGKQ
jgi:hypothetical protein